MKTCTIPDAIVIISINMIIENTIFTRLFNEI